MKLPSLALVAVTLALTSPFATAQAAAGTAAPGAAATSGASTGSQATSSANPGASSDDLSPAAKSYAASVPPAQDPRTPPPAKPGALTLQQVVDRAHLNNPTLLSAEQNLRSVRAQEIQAAVRVNPTLGVTGQNVNINADANNPFAYTASVSRLFERGNKRGYRLDTARATTAMTAAQLQDTIRQTELAVRQAFTTMLIAKEALQLSQAQLKDFRHEVEIGHDRYTAGDLGKLDFERLDLQLGSFESDEQNSEIVMEQASDTLQTLMGIATPSQDFDVIGAIVPPPITQTREQLLALAQQQRPDLLAAQAAVRQSDAQLKLAFANGTTDPTLEMEYDRTGPQNSFGFQAFVPLRLFDRNQGNKETARLTTNATRLTETATRNQVGSDVNQAWSAYIHARVLSNRFGDHYLDESADVLSIARYAFDHGGLALIDYLDALRDARSATSNALNAYSQTWMAIHQLSAATAADLAP